MDSFVQSDWFFFSIPIVWIASGFGLSYFGGWHSLARTYANAKNFPRDTEAMRSAKMRLFWYQKSVHVGSDADGLYLAVVWFLRLGHPRLCIPWTDIDVGPETVKFFRARRTFCLGNERIPLTLHGWLAAFLLKNWN